MLALFFFFSKLYFSLIHPMVNAGSFIPTEVFFLRGIKRNEIQTAKQSHERIFFLLFSE